MSQKRNHWIALVVFLIILAIAFLLGNGLSRYLASLAGKPQPFEAVLPLQKVSLVQVEQVMGCTIPTPHYLPQGYSLEEVYLVSPPGNGDHIESPATQLQHFYLKFKAGDDAIIMSLYGGDTRDKKSLSKLGDVPAAFDLKGEIVTVIGLHGVAQSNLDEPNALGVQVHSRLVWRFPCASSKFTNLKAIFLMLESDSVSTSELLKIATSVTKPE